MSGTNPTASYTQTNHTTTNAAAYTGQIDANSVAAARVVDQFLPHQSVTPNMTITLDAGSIMNSTNSPVLTEVASQVSGTITAPSGSNKRIDRAVINALTGVLSIVTGTPTTGTPSAPTITAGCFPVAQIGTVASPLLSTTTAITNAMVVDERNFWGVTAGELPLGALATQSNNTVLANISGGTASPSADTLTAIIDACIGSTQGNVLYRGASAWNVLAPGTSGQFLQTQGSSANPQWANAVGQLHYTNITSSGNFTTPSATTSSTQFKITITGGGGGGGQSGGNAAPGGGAASTAVYIATGLSPSTNYSITIGGAGAGGTSGAGSAGGSSIAVFGATTVTAPGGGAGTAGLSQVGGAGGGACTNATLSILGGGGGANANQGGAQFSGIGGSSFWGGGGGGVATTGNGVAGQAYGSGGGGSSSTGSAGGAGANGVCVIEWVL